LATAAWSSHIPTEPSVARSYSTATEPRGKVATMAEKAACEIVILTMPAIWERAALAAS
jgi:hypothetical protein